jgi:hypothetical protein
VGASLLPHVCGGIASYVMAIEKAIQNGLLPTDPGQPWTAADTPEEDPCTCVPGDTYGHVPGCHNE